MKTIIWSAGDWTVMSVKSGNIVLKISKNFDHSKVKDLLRLATHVLTDILNTDADCYAYFTFEGTRATIILSANPVAPNVFDLRYRRDW